MNFERLLHIWHGTFGGRPVHTAALRRQACNGNAELAAAIGVSIPSARSLGRLLAAREGKSAGGLRLIRCPGRMANVALWRIEVEQHCHRPG